MINFCLLNSQTHHPTRGTAFSSGWDLYFPSTQIIRAGERLRVNMEVQVFLPCQTVGMLALRSSVAQNWDLSIRGGIIGGKKIIVITRRWFNTVSFFPDRDYTGPVHVVLRNHSVDDIVLPGGVSFVQLVPLNCHETPMDSKVARVVRGPLGFGSTNAN
jgi:dUTP pyrophosphatase